MALSYCGYMLLTDEANNSWAFANIQWLDLLVLHVMNWFATVGQR